ncbi:adenylate/guanylate cyclase domain-containing protein [Mycobacterium sp. SM1]|uniref:adenylate/guanylate cyclase domain-containing protein n=1 Tax=Mycobacterium sp. SM1 TaxID=2816243 RepID=UPI0027DC39CF|nr:adenylate/guanylate cyclase domain-containing protein [Mycobacterium sp. SM1]
MVEALDFDALEALGIANARERAPLIEYLAGLGFTAQEMAEAERRGRLFGLAGDVLQWSGPRTYSLRSAAEALDVPVADVAHAWAMLGLTVADPDTAALTQADVDGLATWVALRAQIGADAACGLLRVIGATVARLAEAESAVVRVGAPDVWITQTHDELTTARAYRRVNEFIPRIGAMFDAVHRHHLVAARAYFESVSPQPAASVVCGVGFVDLSGFTALTQMLTPEQLSAMLTEFGATVTDVVRADEGRVVKFIGDAVMWVSPTVARLARTAVDLVDHPRVREVGLRVRAGLGYGEMLAVDGDYFGNPVNLAARLVAAARPGQILAAPEIRDKLPDWPAIAQDPLPLKGFHAPVKAYDLSGGQRPRGMTNPPQRAD